VWSNLAMTAHLSEGQLLLLHGGSSGIGSHAIQVARALGVRVAITAGSAEKLAFCRDLGAQITINYRDEDFVARLRDETDGADVILDIMGAAYLQRNVATLAIGGRLVVIGLQGGATGELDLGTMLRNRLTVQAASLRARPVGEKAAVVAGVRADVWPLVASGQVKPVIETVLPLAEAAAAHQLMEAGGHVGKILLTTAG
jgi:NADPH:quinone reductase-like Zn-dependent oxidoreductase